MEFRRVLFRSKVPRRTQSGPHGHEHSVGTADSEFFPIWRNGHRHWSLLEVKGVSRLTRGNVPAAHCIIGATRGHDATVGREFKRTNLSLHRRASKRLKERREGKEGCSTC